MYKQQYNIYPYICNLTLNINKMTKKELKEDFKLTKEEQAKIAEERDLQQLIAAKGKQIQEILDESGLTLVVNPNSPVGNMSIIIIPV